MTDPRRCIHGRTERQACAKCNAMDAAPAEGLTTAGVTFCGPDEDPHWHVFGPGREPDGKSYATEDEAIAAVVAAERAALAAPAEGLREAARDLYSGLVSEHGHDETHSADWPACLPVHIAMNRYRAALTPEDDR